MLELSVYQEMEHIVGRDDVIIVMDPDTKKRYIKKLLRIYDKSVYEYLKENPVRHMPRIVALYESSNSLIVLEECIDGRTLAEMIEEKTLSEQEAVRIAKKICLILNDLHNLPTPIIHRDIKPSNIILTPSGEVFLLDVNVAKWYDPKKTDDTRHMGTENYAAPEQAGYGLSASSAKSDIYAVGVLLNVMLTGNIPKEERAAGPIWDIIEQCIKLNAEDRYTAIGLYEALDRLISS